MTSQRHALVTGGAGFLGSHLCDRLLELGYRVTCIDNLFTGHRTNIEHALINPNFAFVEHDVTTPWNIPADLIFHLACPASPIQYQRNPVDTLRTAIVGTENALRAARDHGARVLIASTSEVYGDPLVHPQPETYWGNVNPIGTRACYDEGKRAAEAMAVAYTAQYGVDSRIARIFNTYGPRMQPGDGRVVSNFVDQALRGNPITIYGNGSQTRSFCYVSDLIDGLITIVKVVREPGERAKVAVESYDDRIDPVGACVGMKGSRIHAVVRELQNENIDVINFTENLDLYVSRALSPAKVSSLSINKESKRISVFLKPDQVSLAIGKGGFNIKLASRLVGYEIDVFRELNDHEEEDVDLNEFSDEIDQWIIDELKKTGLDTAKSVLVLSKEDLIRRTELEEVTIDEIFRILRTEFDQ